SSQHTSPSPSSPLSLHDALPISLRSRRSASHRPSRSRSSASLSPTRRTRVHAAMEFDRYTIALLILRPDAPDLDEEAAAALQDRSEEHTSELQSRFDLVCRLLLE